MESLGVLLGHSNLEHADTVVCRGNTSRRWHVSFGGSPTYVEGKTVRRARGAA